MYIRMKYRQVPYVIVSAFFLIGCSLTGMLVVGGAHYIRDMAYQQGQSEILVELPIEALQHIEVEHEI